MGCSVKTGSFGGAQWGSIPLPDGVTFIGQYENEQSLENQKIVFLTNKDLQNGQYMIFIYLKGQAGTWMLKAMCGICELREYDILNYETISAILGTDTFRFTDKTMGNIIMGRRSITATVYTPYTVGTAKGVYKALVYSL